MKTDVIAAAHAADLNRWEEDLRFTAMSYTRHAMVIDYWIPNAQGKYVRTSEHGRCLLSLPGDVHDPAEIAIQSAGDAEDLTPQLPTADDHLADLTKLVNNLPHVSSVSRKKALAFLRQLHQDGEMEGAWPHLIKDISGRNRIMFGSSRCTLSAPAYPSNPGAADDDGHETNIPVPFAFMLANLAPSAQFQRAIRLIEGWQQEADEPSRAVLLADLKKLAAYGQSHPAEALALLGVFELGRAVAIEQLAPLKKYTAAGRRMNRLDGKKQQLGAEKKIERRAAFVQAMAATRPAFDIKHQKWSDGYLVDLAAACEDSCSKSTIAAAWCCSLVKFTGRKVGEYLKLVNLSAKTLAEAKEIVDRSLLEAGRKG